MHKVDLVFDLFSPSGYSCHGRALIKSLLMAGIELGVVNNRHDRTVLQFPAEQQNLYNKLLVIPNTRGKPDFRIFMETPEFYRPEPGVVNIGFTMWETTGIPDTDLNGEPRNNWVTQMNRMDHIWTGSHFSKRVFENSGVKTPIHVVAGPIDTDVFGRLGLDELPLEQVVMVDGQYVPRDKRKITFGCVAQWSPRKNIEDFLMVALSCLHKDRSIIVLKTYLKEMSTEDKMKCFEFIRRIKTQVNNPNAPGIALIHDSMSDEDMAKLYTSFDYIVNTSRGEGLCLPLLQGMASGAIPISNEFSAPGDYVTPGVGVPIRYSLEPAIHVAGHPWYRFNQRWGRVDPEHLANELYQAENRPETARTAMSNMARRAVAPHGLEAIADQVGRWFDANRVQNNEVAHA